MADAQTLTGRVAVITGGSGVLGTAMARTLRDLGARVASWDLALTSSVDAATVVDVTDEDAVRFAIKSTIEALGRIGGFPGSESRHDRAR